MPFYEGKTPIFSQQCRIDQEGTAHVCSWNMVLTLTILECQVWRNISYFLVTHLFRTDSLTSRLRMGNSWRIFWEIIVWCWRNRFFSSYISLGYTYIHIYIHRKCLKDAYCIMIYKKHAADFWKKVNVIILFITVCISAILMFM